MAESLSLLACEGVAVESAAEVLEDDAAHCASAGEMACGMLSPVLAFARGLEDDLVFFDLDGVVLTKSASKSIDPNRPRFTFAMRGGNNVSGSDNGGAAVFLNSRNGGDRTKHDV